MPEKDQPEEFRRRHAISPPHSARFQHESIGPFNANPANPLRRSRIGTRIEIKYRTDRPYYRNSKLMAIGFHPLLLLGSRHADPKDIRLGSIDDLYHLMILLLAP